MNENRKQILEILADGKITVDEAERLIAALEDGHHEREPVSGSPNAPSEKKPKYLRVVVESDDDGAEGPTKVNIRVPMQLLRAGVRLAGLIPAQARGQVNTALKEHGIDFDISQIKPDNLEELIENLNDLTVDVDEKNQKVRIFCE